MREPNDHANRLSNELIGAAIEVHRELGPGYHESIYENALEVELNERKVPVRRQHTFAVYYKGHLVGEGRTDMFLDDELVVELKSVEKLMPIHSAQIKTYLRALQKDLGILINFNVPMLSNGVKRVVLTH